MTKQEIALKLAEDGISIENIKKLVNDDDAIAEAISVCAEAIGDKMRFPDLCYAVHTCFGFAQLSIEAIAKRIDRTAKPWRQGEMVGQMAAMTYLVEIALPENAEHGKLIGNALAKLMRGKHPETNT